MMIDEETLIGLAREEAKRYQHQYIRTEHVLLALMTMTAGDTLTQFAINPASIRQAVSMMHCPQCNVKGDLDLSPSSRRALGLAHAYALDQPMQFRFMLRGIVESSQTVRQLLERCDVDLTLLSQLLESESSL